MPHVMVTYLSWGEGHTKTSKGSVTVSILETPTEEITATDSIQHQKLRKPETTKTVNSQQPCSVLSERTPMSYLGVNINAK